VRRLLCTAAVWAASAASLLAQNQTMECGQPADVFLNSSTTFANINFQGHQGETVYIRLFAVAADPGFSLSQLNVSDPYGNVYVARSHTQTTPGATPVDMAGLAGGEGYSGYEFDLPGDGTYTFRLTSASPTFGAKFHITLTRLNRPCPTSNSTLSCGQSKPGQLSSTSPGQVNTYQFNATAGDLISFRLLRVANSGFLNTGTSFFFAIYAADPALNAAAGTTNAVYAVNNIASGGSTTGRLSSAQVSGRYDWKATVTGTVTVVVFEFTGSIGGDYYISATKLNGGCGGQTLSCNSTVDSLISTPLTLSFYSIQATAGDVYQIRTARASISGTFAPTAEVYDATGAKIGTVGPGTINAHAAVSSLVTLPSSGTFTVIVSGPPDGSTGQYSIGALRLNRPCDGAAALACSSVVDGTVSGLIRNQVYALPAAANDVYLLRILQPNAGSLFRPRVDIYDPTGNSLQFLSTTDLTRITITTGTAGTYTLVVTDSYDNSQSGSYTLSTLRLNRPCNATPLTCGAPVAGAFPRTLATGVYSYDGSSGDSFSIRMLPGSGVPLAGLEVYDAKGNAVGQSLTGSFAGVDVVQPAPGPYSILALDSSKTPSPTTFALDLLRTTNACGITAPQGTTVRGVISTAEPFLTYSIPGSAGDLLAVRSASSTPGFAAQMEIYDPTGARLDTAVFGLSRKLATSGAYTVILGAAAARSAGGYSFLWQLLNKPAGTTPLACGGTIGGAISAANAFRYYTAAAGAGDILRLLFTRTSDNFNPQIELFDPNGVRVASNSDVTQKSAAGGTYLVLVSPSTTAVETGSYSLALQRPNNPCTPQSLTCGQTSLRQVNLPGQLDAFTFAATGGDISDIRLVSRSGNYTPFVELYDGNGALISTTSSGLIKRVLPLNATYSLLVRDVSAVNLGSYRVTLQDDSNTCSVADSENPVITLLSPTGGEVMPGGTTFTIRWQSDDNVGIATHDIALSTDAGKTFATPIATSLSGNAQTYNWSVPSGIAPSRTAVLRVTATDGAGNAQSAVSDLLTLIGSGFTPNVNLTLTYDGVNRLTQAALDDGRTIQYMWDAAGNLLQITITGQ
jgi:YD repeat-containing protein